MINKIWQPPLDLSIAEWADKFRRLSPEASSEPGRWNTNKAPYQREIMNAIKDMDVERVVLMTAAQIGKTEILLNTIGYFIDQDPGPILMLNPTLEMSEAFSVDRLAPMIRDTPCLAEKIQAPRTRDTENTKTRKKFTNGEISLAGANSPANLAARPIRILLCDEVDRYPGSAGSEGDPLTLAMKRTQNFWNKRVVWVSTPTIKNISRIEKAFEFSSREEWVIPCPSCGEFMPYDWAQIIHKDREQPVMKCIHCNGEFTEYEWKRGQINGRWKVNNPNVKNIRGFHLNSFASPWVSWGSLCNQYEEAHANGEDEYKVWVNTVLGLPYEDTAGVMEVRSLKDHREKYDAEIPEGVLLLTCGVDTQDDRLELEVLGWGMNNETWGIQYKVIYGSPAQAETWSELDDFLARDFYYADGKKINIACTCVDSGGHFTDDVYKFCKLRSRRRIFPIIGRGTFGRPAASKPNTNNRRRVKLFTLGVSTIKTVLHTRLQIEKIGSGYCHFPLDSESGHRGYDNAYFRGLLSERQTLKRSKGQTVIEWEYWDKKARNEPLDCRVYAIGAYEILAPNMNALLAKRIKDIPAQKKAVLNEIAEQEQKKERVSKVRKKSVRVISRGLAM